MLLYLIFYLNLAGSDSFAVFTLPIQLSWQYAITGASHTNKVFKGKAARGKTSTEWFYGLKLFLVINAFGEIMNALLP